MLSRHACLAGALMAALGAADAVAPWSAPVRVGPAGAEVIGAGLGSSGRGLVALSAPVDGTPFGVPIGADGRPGAAYRLVRGATIGGPGRGDVVVYGGDRVIAAAPDGRLTRAVAARSPCATGGWRTGALRLT